MRQPGRSTCILVYKARIAGTHAFAQSRSGLRVTAIGWIVDDGSGHLAIYLTEFATRVYPEGIVPANTPSTGRVVPVTTLRWRFAVWVAVSVNEPFLNFFE